MKREFAYRNLIAGLAVLAVSAAMTLVSCRKDVPVDGGGREAVDDALQVEFSLEAQSKATRATNVTSANEQRIVRWAVFVFNTSGNIVGTPLTAGNNNGVAEAITMTLQPGTYDVWAVANYPTSGAGQFTPANISTKSALRSTVSYLQNNATNAFVLAGGQQMSLTASGTRTVNVKRLVARTGFTKVTVDFGQPGWASAAFTIKRVYLTNVCEVTTFGEDYASASSLTWTRSHWYNTLGYHTSGSGYYNGSSWTTGTNSAIDALTADGSINARVTSGSSYQVPHYYYFYPNPTTEAQDHRTNTWSTSVYHRTRMVLECSLGSNTYYYIVSLPVSARNNSYVASNITITMPGSTDPDMEIPGSFNVTWSADDDGWDTPYSSIHEDS